MLSKYELVEEARYRYKNLRLFWYRLSKSYLSILGLTIVVSIVLMAIFAPHIAPYPEDVTGTTHMERSLIPPSAALWFGTDEVGRDVLTRVIFGSRSALTTAFIVVTFAIAVGVPLGLVAGYLGGKSNMVIMRVTDIFMSIPAIALAMVVVSVLGPGLEHGIIAVSFVWWPWYTRVAQGEVLSIREQQFVEASVALGASRIRTAFKEILPNLMTPIMVKASLDAGFAIIVGTTLSFFGLGAQQPAADWGTMIGQGRNYLPFAWWLAAFPGLFVFITVLGFNLLGDGLRDVFDVKIR
jgi:peptide/nickel transport system permease protein